MKRNYVWFIFLSLIWPLVQILIFGLRFQRLPDNIWESFYFLPMGIFSAAFLLFMLGKTAVRTTRVSTIVGYLVACPIALVGGLGGGLVLSPLLGVTLFGAVPLMVGTAVGYGMGKLVSNSGNVPR
ncbi:MAG: hypothetical protein IPJ90_20640 [Anaerolineaceae bacterium]|nr:hypothetical protein [Anaerolineaceae bacterium]